MDKNKKDEDYRDKWIALIKSDNISGVVTELKDRKIDEKLASDCLVAISQICYGDAKKGRPLNSLPEDVLHVTEHFSSVYGPTASKSTLRYLTCLYHTLYWLLKKDCLEQVATLFKTVVKFKQNNSQSYQDEAKSLHDPFNHILRGAVVKVVSQEGTEINESILTQLFSLILEINIDNQTLSNGKTLLEVILQAAQVVSTRDNGPVVCVVSSGLSVFNNSDKVKDLKPSLSLLYQLYSFLFYSQNKVSDYLTALAAVKLQLDNAKWKFTENAQQGECFLLACNSVNILMGNCSENTTMKKIRENTDILKRFQESGEDEVVLATCGFVAFLILSLQATKKQTTIPPTCLESLLKFVLYLYKILNTSVEYKTEALKALTMNFFCVASLPDDEVSNKKVLKDCVKHLLETEECIESSAKQLMESDHPKAMKEIPLILVRFANLIRTYYLAEMIEEVIAISKRVCKFMVSLPADVFENSQNVRSFELCFTCIMRVFSSQQLRKGLEWLVMWLCKFPHSSAKVFKIWVDMKHNAICDGKEDGLEINVWTILNDGKSDLEKELSAFNISDVEIGKFLVQELNAYYGTRTLRGKPVISAANALLDLDVDCLTLVKGIVIAMDIASGNPNFSDLCTAYHNKSKTLMCSLRKQKKKFDPVEFNCCMGDLLYAQLRCQIKYLRSECECEMVKLTVSPSKPLVAELPESRPDPNDTCDVTTRYQHLCLAQQRKLMDTMDSAIRHWGFAYHLLKDCPKREVDLKVTMLNMQDAGQMLKLYCDEVKEERVWNILYDMALVVGDVNMLVRAAGELMNVGKSLAPEVLAKLTSPDLCHPELSESTAVTYSLKSALFALKNDKIHAGLACLKNVEEYQTKSNLQKSQLYSVVGKFQLLPDWKKYNHSFNSCSAFHFTLHLSLRRLLFQVEEMKWRGFGDLCEQQQELLIVANLLGEANWALDQPREARSYLKTVFPIVQKLALPLRTVQILLLLAWVDFNTGEVEACVRKLEGVEDLLELCGTPVVYGRSVDSPPLNKTLLKPPDYLSHPPACQCLPCTTVEYRRLVLETLTLRSAFCAAFGLTRDAAQSFQVAMLVEKELSKSDIRQVCKSCASMWLRYAEFKAGSHDYGEAMLANEKATHLLSSVRDPIAHQRAFEQKTVIQLCLHQLKFAPLRPKIVIHQGTTLTPSKTLTPKCMKSKVTVESPLATIDNNTNPVTPFVRPVRRLRIPSSGEENTPIEVTKQKRKTKLPPKFPNKTVQHTSTLLKSSSKSFVIVDDDGKAVAVSGTKNLVTSRKKIADLKGDNKITSKKKLFRSEPPVQPSNDFDEPLTSRQIRKPQVRTYGNSKSTSRKVSSQNGSNPEILTQCKDKSKKSCNEDVFFFDKLKDSIHEIESCTSESNVETMPFNVPSSNKQNSNFSGELALDNTDSSRMRSSKSNKKFSIDSNCDYIDGTPPETEKKSVSLIPRRVTRANKVCNK